MAGLLRKNLHRASVASVPNRPWPSLFKVVQFLPRSERTCRGLREGCVASLA